MQTYYIRCPEDLLYVFGGLKYVEITDGDIMVNIGLGKHWDIGNRTKIVTEVAAYQSTSGESKTQMGLKLGLGYAFSGSIAPSSSKDSDNDAVFARKDPCSETQVGTTVDTMGCIRTWMATV